MPILKLKNVCKVFGKLTILNNINIEINKGEIVSIIGPSGSGKTTILRCINALEYIDIGEIYFKDQLIEKRSKNIHKLREDIGYIFQSFNLFPHLKVIDNIILAQRIVKKRSSKIARDIAIDLLNKVGLKDKLNNYPNQLSGGQQQRVAIARAMAMNPVILLMDEITSALDPELISEVLEVVIQLAKEGMTMVIVSHEMNFVRDISHNIIVLDKGEIIEMGEPKDIFTNPRKERTRSFLKKFIKEI